jgi:hypothetical protein
MAFKKICIIFFGSITGTLFCAFLYAVMVKLTLEHGDEAHNLPLAIALIDPFMITIGGLFGTLSGLAVFLINCFFLWHRNIYTSGIIILLIVSIEIIVVSLVRNTFEAWLFSYCTYFVALFIARYSKFRIFENQPKISLE